MRSTNYIKTLVLAALIYASLVFQACQQPGGDSPGSEFMPDMAHSVAYEANYYNYYYNNTWGSQEDYYTYAKPREPVKGTVPRRSTDVDRTSSGIVIPANGRVPYYYDDSDAERDRATAEIIDNPLDITESGLAVGKELYNIYCGICHGDKGDGAGYIAREDGGKYLAQPANLLLDEFVAASNGRYYHALMYGKNLMSGYADKLSYEERWQVIHYVRSLQAKDKGLVYSQLENTLNAVDRPAGVPIADVEDSPGVVDDDSDHAHDDAHGDDDSNDVHHGHETDDDHDH